MAKFSVKIVSFLLLLVVAVQAQEFFQDSEDQTSYVPSESGITDEYGFTLPNMEFPMEPHSNSFEEKTSLSSFSVPETFDDHQDSDEETNFPFETQDEEASVSSESEFPQVSEEENAEPFKSHRTPPPSPSPLPPKAPKRPVNSCGKNCATKCMTKTFPLLRNLCTKICRQKCLLVHVEAIYKCTTQCAESMPKNFKSDSKKTAGYVKYCYNKCVKV